jgi:hypothetical protein
VRAVMARPHQVSPPATANATTYRDNWFDKLAIGYLSQNLQEASGTYAAHTTHLLRPAHAAHSTGC